MRKISIILLALALPFGLQACELCKTQQPSMWRGVTHGPGPEGDFDQIITWIAMVIVVITLFFSIKLLVRPKEGDPAHIKNIVVDDDGPTQ